MPSSTQTEPSGSTSQFGVLSEPETLGTPSPREYTIHVSPSKRAR